MRMHIECLESTVEISRTNGSRGLLDGAFLPKNVNGFHLHFRKKVSFQMFDKVLNTPVGSVSNYFVGDCSLANNRSLLRFIDFNQLGYFEREI